MTRSAGTSRDVIAIRTLGLDWAVAGDDIEEVLPHRAAVRAPGSAPFVEGIVRYRDGILPVVDLALRFRLPPGAERPPAPRPEARRTLVVRITGGLAGLTVDEVVGSRPVGQDGLAPLPRPVMSPVVRGCLVADDGDLLVVLDPRRILETEEPLDLPLPVGWRRLKEEPAASQALPAAPTPSPGREEAGAPPSSGAPPGSGTPALDRPVPPRAAPPSPPPADVRAAPPRPVPERPPAAPEPPGRPAEASPSALPAAPSPSPARPEVVPPPGSGARSGPPPARTEPAARPSLPARPPERAPSARPAASAPPRVVAPALPGAPAPSPARPEAGSPPSSSPARPEVGAPSSSSPARGRPGARPGSALPGAPSPSPARELPGAPHSSPATMEPEERRRPGRWIAAAAAVLVALGAGLFLVTQVTREEPAKVAVGVPAASRALPTAPPPAPAREEVGGAGAVASPALPGATSPSPAREEVGAPPASDRLVLTIEERLAADTGPAAGGETRETIEEVVEYTVVRGDTLWAIARRFTKNPFHYREIASDNDLRNPHLIFPGQHLTLRIRRLAPASSP